MPGVRIVGRHVTCPPPGEAPPSPREDAGRGRGRDMACGRRRPSTMPHRRRNRRAPHPAKRHPPPREDAGRGSRRGAEPPTRRLRRHPPPQGGRGPERRRPPHPARGLATLSLGGERVPEKEGKRGEWGAGSVFGGARVRHGEEGMECSLIAADCSSDSHLCFRRVLAAAARWFRRLRGTVSLSFRGRARARPGP
jgi:hypothetical protein